jgi:hypothetical protein
MQQKAEEVSAFYISGSTSKDVFFNPAILSSWRAARIIQFDWRAWFVMN